MALLRPCRNTAAFEVIPERELRIDLDAVEHALAARGFVRVVRAGVMLIMRAEIEVSVYRSGKMLLKTRDPEVATRIAADVLPFVLPIAGEELRTEGLERMQRAARASAGGA